MKPFMLFRSKIKFDCWHIASLESALFLCFLHVCKLLLESRPIAFGVVHYNSPIFARNWWSLLNLLLNFSWALGFWFSLSFFCSEFVIVIITIITIFLLLKINLSFQLFPILFIGYSLVFISVKLFLWIPFIQYRISQNMTFFIGLPASTSHIKLKNGLQSSLIIFLSRKSVNTLKNCVYNFLIGIN